MFYALSFAPLLCFLCVWEFLFAVFSGVFGECLLEHYVCLWNSAKNSDTKHQAGVPTTGGILCDLIIFLPLIQSTQTSLAWIPALQSALGTRHQAPGTGNRTFVGHCPPVQKRLHNCNPLDWTHCARSWWLRLDNGWATYINGSPQQRHSIKFNSSRLKANTRLANGLIAFKCVFV